MVTGATQEYIDPIRYISNESSGQQGEIAIALNKLGIKTTLITGPSKLISPRCKKKKIISADDMLNEAKKLCLLI